MYQGAALIVTLAISISSGALGGFIAGKACGHCEKLEEPFEDKHHWHSVDDDHTKIEITGGEETITVKENETEHVADPNVNKVHP